MSTPKRNNSILSYFARTPTSGSKKDKDSSVRDASSPLRAQSNGSASPKKSARPSTPQTTPTSSKKVKSSVGTPKSSASSAAFTSFDIVIAKLDGYPPWPAMICDDPEKKTFVSNFKYHVQFFDEQSSHSWILKRDVKEFEHSSKMLSLSRITDKKLRKAHQQAIEAVELGKEERVKLLVDLNDDEIVSDDESMNVDESEEELSKKRKLDSSISSDEGRSKQPAKRRRRVILEDDGSDDDFKPNDSAHSSSEEGGSGDESPDASSPEEDESEEDVTPKKKTPARRAPSGKTPAKTKDVSVTSSSSSPSPVGSTAVNHIEAADRKWPHISLEFLQPETIRDAKHRPMLINGEMNPEYDFTTLYIPSSFIAGQSPAMRQWWKFKSENFDTILFFKMGKFYEVFHMDAVVATKELQILFMRGEHAHAGFPEKSFKRYADGLIQRGYKVARIEQTETPAMMEERIKKMSSKVTKFDRVVRRELCRVASVGTRVMSDIDSDAFVSTNSYLFAISCSSFENSVVEFGICFIDVSIGKFYLSQFQDDQNFSTFRTMLVHYSPSEILFAGSNKELSKIIDAVFPNVRKQPCRKFRSATDTLKLIGKEKYWEKMPQEFTSKILDSGDTLQHTCCPEYEFAINSLGGIIDYLEKALISDDILSMKNFEIYYPPEKNSTQVELGSHLILDASCMQHMEVVNLKGDDKKSLLKIIDKCVTPFGKRLFRGWVCLPLCGRKDELMMRQDAVRELVENEKLYPKIRQIVSVLQKLPDLERLLTQIHSQSSLKRSKDHPDSRAIMFDIDIYRKRKIGNFLTTIEGFEKILELVNSLQDIVPSISSALLRKLLTFEGESSGGRFPKYEETLQYFRKSFDVEKARKLGNIVPEHGADEEYDCAIETYENAIKAIEKYLSDQTKFFNARCSYFGSGKNRYQLEIPEIHAKKAMDCKTDKYVLKSTRKGYKRYYTTTLLGLIAKLDQAEECKALALRDIFRRLLEKFDQQYSNWSRAIHLIAQLDALITLSKTKQIFELNGSTSCMPTIVWDSKDAQFVAEELRNATLIETRELIPNNIELKNQTLVLTGPNMAGKTTLMRSVGLAVILGQIGAYVPAASCQMTPVDRIFTRIGAYDQAMEAQSTFMVELNETASIVNRSNSSSLVLVDELGRGTSTFDGIAIASAVLEHLSQNIRCRTIFSTHFHSIVDDISGLAVPVKVGHMAYLVENSVKANPTEEDVIFLYQLTDGVCSQSYGYNVAKMAGIPADILRCSYKAGRAFQLKVESCRLLNDIIESKEKEGALVDAKLDKLADFLSEMFISNFE